MRLIKLNHGYFAKVDDADFDWLNKSIWGIAKRKGVVYAQTNCKINGKWQPVLMHKIIMNTPKGMRTDHKDMDGLNNQRSNLRICTASQNLANSNKNRGKSKYRGVTIRSRKSVVPGSSHTWTAYRVRIRVNRKEISIGFYKTEKEAAEAYNCAAIKYQGEFARLNKI